MRVMRALLAEMIKLLTLPAAWVGLAVTIVGTAIITLLNVSQTLGAYTDSSGVAEWEGQFSAFEAGFAAVPLGTIGAIVVGVIAASSEYTANSPDAGGGRQISLSLAAVPRRLRLVSAKIVVVVAVTLVSAAVALLLCQAIAQWMLGDAVSETVTEAQAAGRMLGAALYWVLTALMAFGITLITRSGAIPLLVLIVNSSVVSVSLLLTNLTTLANWLPDMAGRNLFGFSAESSMPGGLDPVPGGFVMAAWTLVIVASGVIVFRRRDA